MSEQSSLVDFEELREGFNGRTEAFPVVGYEQTVVPGTRPRKINRANDYLWSIGWDEEQIINGILTLHNGGAVPMVDATYSVGWTWRNRSDKPKFKFDISPQMDGVVEADAADLSDHLADNSVSSYWLDPPYLIRTGNGKGSKMKERFGDYPSVPDLKASYKGMISEAYRALQPNGILIFKVKGMVSSGKNNMLDHVVATMAEAAGFYYKDRAIMEKRGMVRPGKFTQRHLHKSDVHYMVFEKKVKRGRGS